MHVQIKYSLLSTSTILNSYFGWCITYIYIFYQPKNLVDVLENALFVHAFDYTFELIVTGWCIVAT